MLCGHCGVERPVDDFPVKRARGRNPYRSGKCRPCTREYNAGFQKRKNFAYNKAYNLRKKYGITQEEYDALLLAQGGCCAICRKPETVYTGRGKGVSNRLCVDHDHVTGKVRGLLCNACNTSLGKMNDDPTLLVQALTYLGFDVKVKRR